MDETDKLWDSAAVNTAFPKLQVLTLFIMPELRYVWHEKLCEGSQSFGSLKKIKIDYCRHLKGLFPPSVPAALLQLESLEIADCHSLKEIVISETNAGIDLLTNEIVFPKLRWLRLESLPSFICFYLGKSIVQFPALKTISLIKLHSMVSFIKSPNNQQSETANNEAVKTSIECPSLETANIINCPNMESFTFDSLYTPVLSFLRVDEIYHQPEVDQVHDLNILLSEAQRVKQDEAHAARLKAEKTTLQLENLGSSERAVCRWREIIRIDKTEESKLQERHHSDEVEEGQKSRHEIAAELAKTSDDRGVQLRRFFQRNKFWWYGTTGVDYSSPYGFSGYSSPYRTSECLSSSSTSNEYPPYECYPIYR